MASACNSDVVVTGKNKLKNFKELIATSGEAPVVAFFFSPGCGWCQRMKPVFEQLRSQCISKQSKAKLVVVDLSTAPEIFEEYEVQEFPRVMIFKKGQVTKDIKGFNTAALSCAFKEIGLRVDIK